MTELAVVVTAFALAALTLSRFPPLHPAQLWAGAWLVTCGLYAAKLIPYNPLRPTTAAIIIGGGLAFTISSWLIIRIASRQGSLEPVGVSHRHYRHMRLSAAGLLVLTSLGLAAFLVQVAAEHGVVAALVSDPDVRVSLREGHYVVTIKFVYASLAAAMASALAAAICPTGRGRASWCALTLAAIGSTYFSTGRSNFVTALAMATVVYLVARPVRLNGRHMALGVLAAGSIIVVTLYVGGSLIGKTYRASELATVDTVFSRTASFEVLALPYQYVTAPIASLNELVPSVGAFGTSAGCATVSLACSAGSAAGLPLEPVPAVRVFTAPPLKWNTYTALDAPLLDGGPVLAIGVVALLGALAGWVWLRAQRGVPVYVVAYGAFGTAALSSVIQNNFFAPHYLGAILLFALAWLILAGLDPRDLDEVQ